MPKSILLLIVMLEITTTSASMARAQITNRVRPAQLRTLQCVTRGFRVTVTLQPNQRYRATRSNNPKLANGRYTTVGLADRFKTGGLQGQSIVRQNGSIYLVATTSEARAAELAKFDGALVCTRQ